MTREGWILGMPERALLVKGRLNIRPATRVAPR